MPKLSAKKVLLKDLEETILLSLMADIDDDKDLSWPEDSSEESSSDSDLELLSDGDLDDDIELFPFISSITVDASRYVSPRIFVPKSLHFFNDVLPKLDDERFRNEMRVSRRAFDFIVNEIKDHEIFISNKPMNPQLPVHHQLAIALYRLGRYGNAASQGMVARHFGVAEGTVVKCTNRVIQSLYSLKSYLQWYTPSEKRIMKRRIEKEMGFPDCVGFLDGSIMVFDIRPVKDYTYYFNRKCDYGVNIQIVCDLDGRIRFFFSGFPSSVHDARCIRNSPLIARKESFFEGEEYVLGDSAYPLSRHIITPFRNLKLTGIHIGVSTNGIARPA